MPTSRRHPLIQGEAASTELAREINRDALLDLIRTHQPVARVDLVRFSGLQNSTVSAIVEQLLDEGWIREGEAVKTARGRRPTQISLHDRHAMLVADVRPGHATVGAVDLNGRLLSQELIPLPTDVRPGVETLASGLLRVRAQHADRTFQGAGICLPGRVDPAIHRLLLAPNLRWQDFALAETLSARLGMPVELENDANACLMAELWFGNLEGVRDAVLLAISEGLGAALLTNGQLVYGHQGMAGEFGHVCHRPGGPLCGCGRRGCWEVFASSTAALARYNEATRLVSDLTYGELAQRAVAGDPAASEAICAQATEIGRGLRMVTAALAPEVITFAGEITLAWPLIEPILQEQCARYLLAGQPPRVLCATAGEVGQLLGAAAVVLQRHKRYYHSRTAARESGAVISAAAMAYPDPLYAASSAALPGAAQ